MTDRFYLHVFCLIERTLSNLLRTRQSRCERKRPLKVLKTMDIEILLDLNNNKCTASSFEAIKLCAVKWNVHKTPSKCERALAII